MSVILKSLFDKNEKIIIGLISGTSKDGIDAVLVRVSGSGLNTETELINFVCLPYEVQLRKRLEGLDSHCSVGEISELNFEIGRSFAEAALKVVKEAGLNINEIDLIGSHGQTVYHNPPSYNNGVPSTLQIGEADVIAELTGVTTVGDFRTRDLAAGGEAAPLVPYLDYLLFSKRGQVRLAQNIGGIGNVTVIPDDIDKVFAFDTGPGNMLMDKVMGLASNWEKSYDKDGRLAKSGTINSDLFNKLMSHPYFLQEPPKSTGEEIFGLDMALELFSLVNKGAVSLKDVMATLVAFTAESIAQSYEKYVFPSWDISEVIFSGGGCKNPVLMERLKGRLDLLICSESDDYGIPSDAKEAVAFAVLANEVISGNVSNLPNVTGAGRRVPMGKISIGRP